MDINSLLEELRSQGIKDEILEVIKSVKREKFIPKKYMQQAYENIPLPIGHKATISQPYTVAFMLQELELKPKQNVLEIGTGSGYNAALISRLIGKRGKLYTLEIIPELVEYSKKNLKNYKNIKVLEKDGSKGLQEKAPFDRIIQTAASKSLQKNLIAQLKINGIYLAPIGPSYNQKLIKVRKTKHKIMHQSLGDFIFVPLVKPR
ncbi:protein-L-isoaspartate(D-aspartate) O-methyltransferase [Candidatus Woesearchaeota archaeon]|nr:protein-L-isoaspartate(D-aspartate) O-methyltransferase [Candidatus Woesearchaeota archaeon]